MVDVHAGFAVVALLVGPMIFLRTKGDRLHRIAGCIFIAAMVLLNLTALTVYDMTGGPNQFHLFALISLTTVGFGVARIRRRDILGHQAYMCWAYAGLIMALANRLSPLFPLPIWVGTGLSILVVSILTHFIVRRLASVGSH